MYYCSKVYNVRKHASPHLVSLKRVLNDRHVASVGSLSGFRCGSNSIPCTESPFGTFLSFRRANHALSAASIQDSTQSETNSDLLVGVTDYKRLLFLFSASEDGVPIFKNSTKSNSMNMFVAFSENLVGRYSGESRDAFFLTIVNCNDSSPLPVNPEIRPINNNPYIVDGNHCGIETTRCVLHPIDNLRVSREPFIGSINPSDSDTREILSEILSNIRLYGQKGFCLRIGSTLLSIQYAIQSFRCDIPAQDFITDSSGRHSSNSPCLTCNLYSRYFDPYMMGFLECVEASMLNRRKAFKSLVSASLSLPKGDVLRLLPLFILGKDLESIRTTMNGKLHDQDRTFNFLVKLRSLFPESTVATFLSESEEFRLYNSVDNPFISSNHPDTTGRIRIEFSTYLQQHNCTSAELMHLTHNLFDVLIPLLFCRHSGSERENELLNQSRRFLAKDPDLPFHDYYGVDDSIRDKACARCQSMKYGDDMKWIDDLVFNGVIPQITANMKMVFCFSILPYLMMDSMDDPIVFCIVSFFVVFSCMYNHDGSLQEMERLQMLLTTITLVLEHQIAPSFPTLCLHQCHHLYHYYRINGPLKNLDAYHTEHMFFGLADIKNGGTRFETTLEKKMAYKGAARLHMSRHPTNATAILKSKVLEGNNTLCGINYSLVCRRGAIGWKADEYRFRNDLFPIPTFLDAELCGGISHFLSHGFGDDTGLNNPLNDATQNQNATLSPVINWATPDCDVYRFGMKYPIRSRLFDNSFLECYSSISWNGSVITSCSEKCEDFLTATFSNKCFAITYSINRKVHFFAIRQYCVFRVGRQYHIQALVYELPICRALSFIDSPFCFSVDISQVHSLQPSYTLISLHRLHITDLCFVPVDGSSVFCQINAVCIRQWQFFKSSLVNIPSNESIVSEDLSSDDSMSDIDNTP